MVTFAYIITHTHIYPHTCILIFLYKGFLQCQFTQFSVKGTEGSHITHLSHWRILKNEVNTALGNVTAGISESRQPAPILVGVNRNSSLQRLRYLQCDRWILWLPPVPVTENCTSGHSRKYDNTYYFRITVLLFV